MKALHRTKALAAYEGARVVLKSEMAYPSYMLLKEAARGVMSYMVEDQLNQTISDKTKLSRLLELINTEELSDSDIKSIEILINAENSGLANILCLDANELKSIKHTVKTLIGKHLKEPV